LGTPNGTTTTGFRIFFHSGPTNGVTVNNADGRARFTASNQPFFEYMQKLDVLEVSGSRKWEFQLNGATSFRFTVAVRTKLPDERRIAVYSGPVVSSVAVEPSESTIDPGAQVQLAATLRNSDGTVISGPAVHWSSSDETVATVDGTGQVTAVAQGGATITASSQGRTGTAAITVAASGSPPVHSVEVDPDEADVEEGAELQLFAVVKTEDGTRVFDRVVNWSSSDENVATVDNQGLVTGVAVGNATITAISEGVSGTAAITVTEAQIVESVEIAPAPVEAVVGGHTQLTATLRDGDGNKVTGPVVFWSSSNEGVATVNANGRVTGVSTGVATITAISQSHSGTAKMTVATINAETISAGQNYSCALSTSGAAYCWGSNAWGVLGVGVSGGNFLVPTAVVMPTNMTFESISAGGNTTCALSRDGAAYCWGQNNAGQVGDGTTIERNRPTATAMPEGVVFRSISTNSGSGIGNGYVMALSASGVAYAWGQNSGGGRLGDGTTQDRHLPNPVAMPMGVTFRSISAGPDHVLALSTSGVAYAWGFGSFGRLGYGSTANRSVPTQVTMPGGVSFASVSAGRQHSVALTTTGAAYSWGYNFYGELGIGTSGAEIGSLIPTAVQMPSGVSFRSVSAGNWSGGTHTLALSTTGIAYGWGRNDHGKLGDGTTENRNVPTEVQMPSGITFRSIAAGGIHSLAVSTTGAGYAWGHGGAGRLGDGQQSDSYTPVQVVMNGIVFR
jgi:alpha-tubulin suppressor-like RCC1 family protein